MAILAECPSCRKKQSIKNKLCKCGESLDKAKRSNRVKYWIDYRLKDGSHHREALSKFDDVNPYSSDDAKAVLSKRVVQRKENRIFDVKTESTATFQELTCWYLEEGFHKVYRGKPVKHPEVFERNIKTFNSKFGKTIAAQTTATDLIKYQNDRAIAKKSPATIDQEIGAAKAVINKALLGKLISHDTALTFKQIHRLLVKGSNIKNVIVSPEHYSTIYNALPERSKPVWKIQSYEGTREGEVLCLTIDRVSLTEHLIKLRPEDTKEKKEKLLPMVEEVYSTIAKRIEKLLSQGASGNTKLFTVTKDQYIYDVKKAHQTTGLPYGRFKSDGVTAHSLRHTWKTNAVRANVPKAHRKALQGHSTDEMDERYTHLDKNDLFKAMEQINSFMKGQPVEQDTGTLLRAILGKLERLEKSVDQSVDQTPSSTKKGISEISANPLN